MLDHGVLFLWNAVKQLQFSAPALPFAFDSLSDEVVPPLQIKARAEEHPKVKQPDDEANALSRPAAMAAVKPCPEENRSLVCKAEALRPSSANCFPAKKTRRSSTLMTTGRQSKKAMREAENAAGLEAGRGPSLKMEDVIDVTLADSGALRWERSPLFRCER